MQPGYLSKRAVFFRPVRQARSATGGSRDGWQEAMRRWAGIRYLRGGESVLASRMQGRRPALLTIGKHGASDIELDWEVEVEDLRYQVRELPRETEAPEYLVMLVEAKL